MKDRWMDQLIGTLLRAGVLLAAATTLAGGIWHMIKAGGAMPDYHAFHGEPTELHSVKAILTGIAHGRPVDLIQLGLLLLIATPVARVVLCVVAFAIQRDRTYVGITLVVLTVLIASLAGFRI